MRPIPHLDFKDHLRLMHRQLLPLFFVISSFAMIVFVVIRAGQQGADLPDKGFVASRIGLLEPKAGIPFDAAFAVLSPVELALAPTAEIFAEPQGNLPGLEAGAFGGAEPVRAAADGRVVFAGGAGEKQAVLLVHERDGELVETVYAGLTTQRVSVAGQVRRGQVVGTVSEADGGDFQFGLRPLPALAIEGVRGDSVEIPDDWRGRAPDRLSAAPAGEPLESSALKLETPAAGAPDPGR